MGLAAYGLASSHYAKRQGCYKQLTSCGLISRNMATMRDSQAEGATPEKKGQS